MTKNISKSTVTVTLNPGANITFAPGSTVSDNTKIINNSENFITFTTQSGETIKLNNGEEYFNNALKLSCKAEHEYY